MRVAARCGLTVLAVLALVAASAAAKTSFTGRFLSAVVHARDNEGLVLLPRSLRGTAGPAEVQWWAQRNGYDSGLQRGVFARNWASIGNGRIASGGRELIQEVNAVLTGESWRNYTITLTRWRVRSEYVPVIGETPCQGHGLPTDKSTTFVHNSPARTWSTPVPKLLALNFTTDRDDRPGTRYYYFRVLVESGSSSAETWGCFSVSWQ